jgi:hypothetical protein
MIAKNFKTRKYLNRHEASPVLGMEPEFEFLKFFNSSSGLRGDERKEGAGRRV